MKIKLLLSIIALAFLAACASTSKVSQPEPLRKIANKEVRAEKSWSASLNLRPGLPGLRPLLVAERVFVGESNGRIRAFDAQGEQLWSVKTGLRLTAGPALADGALIFGSMDGEVIAFEALNGAERWRATVSSEVISPPAGDSNLVAVRSGDGRVYGLAPTTGERLWTINRAVPALTLRGAGRVLMDRNAVYMGMDNGRVIALARDTGEPLWEEAVSVPAGRTEIERIVDVDADLLLVEGILFAASYGGDLVALGADSGRVIWRRSLASYSGMDIDATCLYVTDTDSVLWCLDANNGAALWEQDKLKHRGLNAPLAYKGNVLVADYEGYMHAVSGANGQIIGRSKIAGDSVVIPMQQRDDDVYVLDRDGHLQVVSWTPFKDKS
jgi:outer membrane protein assembly factor BamB